MKGELSCTTWDMKIFAISDRVLCLFLQKTIYFTVLQTSEKLFLFSVKNSDAITALSVLHIAKAGEEEDGGFSG